MNFGEGFKDRIEKIGIQFVRNSNPNVLRWNYFEEFRDIGIVFKDSFGVFGEDSSLFREYDFTPMPVKETDSCDFLQFCNVLAYSRLGYAKGLGGFCKAAFLYYCLEHLESEIFHLTDSFDKNTKKILDSFVYL